MSGMMIYLTLLKYPIIVQSMNDHTIAHLPRVPWTGILVSPKTFSLPMTHIHYWGLMRVLKYIYENYVDGLQDPGMSGAATS